MKLYIKTDSKWIITESSLVPYIKKENAEEIEVTPEEHEAIKQDFDTKVRNWKIIEQKEWQRAIEKKEKHDESIKNRNEMIAKQQQSEQEKLSKSAE